jgi:hypothetical protein
MAVVWQVELFVWEIIGNASCAVHDEIDNVLIHRDFPDRPRFGFFSPFVDYSRPFRRP